jgi:hypothetical protein
MFLLITLLIVFLCGVALGPMPGGIKKDVSNAAMQTAHALGLAMFSYANDHDGQYPNGKSSTEVFQKLIDGQYVNDSSIFYVPMSGKMKSVPKQKLKPENVSFDVTTGADLHSSDKLPLVFLTGYKVDYAPGTPAVPVIKPFPRIGREEPTGWAGLLAWLTGQTWLAVHFDDTPGIAVVYLDMHAKFLEATKVLNPDGSWTVGHYADGYVVPNFVPVDFKTDGKVYRQLTPDGALP